MVRRCGYFLAAPAAAQDVKFRVVDVGAGLCVIAATDDGHVMVYDTGAGSKICGDAVDELAPAQQIDLLIFSHSDIDHIGAARRILADHHVKTIIHPGDPRDGATIARVRHDISQEPGASIIDLGAMDLPFGTAFALGSAVITFVAGWSNATEIYDHDPPLDGDGHKAERYNGISIVMRLEYAGKSILLTGDTLGLLPLSASSSRAGLSNSMTAHGRKRTGRFAAAGLTFRPFVQQLL